MIIAFALTAVSLTFAASAASDTIMRGRSVGPTFSDLCGNPLTDALRAGLLG